MAQKDALRTNDGHLSRVESRPHDPRGPPAEVPPEEAGLPGRQCVVRAVQKQQLCQLGVA